MHDLPTSRCNISAISRTHPNIMTQFLTRLLRMEYMDHNCPVLYIALHCSLEGEKKLTVSNANAVLLLSLLYRHEHTVLPHG